MIGWLKPSRKILRMVLFPSVSATVREDIQEIGEKLARMKSFTGLDVFALEKHLTKKTAKLLLRKQKYSLILASSLRWKKEKKPRVAPLTPLDKKQRDAKLKEEEKLLAERIRKGSDLIAKTKKSMKRTAELYMLPGPKLLRPKMPKPSLAINNGVAGEVLRAKLRKLSRKERRSRFGEDASDGEN